MSLTKSATTKTTFQVFHKLQFKEFDTHFSRKDLNHHKNSATVIERDTNKKQKSVTLTKRPWHSPKDHDTHQKTMTLTKRRWHSPKDHDTHQKTMTLTKRRWNSPKDHDTHQKTVTLTGFTLNSLKKIVWMSLLSNTVRQSPLSKWYVFKTFYAENLLWSWRQFTRLLI